MAPYPTLPPFPDGLLECPLRRISLAKLCSEPPDADEAARLVDACETTGFFYLDLSDNPTNSRLGTDLIDNADNLVTVAKEAFKLPLEEKEQYSMMKAQTFFGYKPKGQKPKSTFDSSKAVPDAVEFFNVARDHVLSPSGKVSAAGNSTTANGTNGTPDDERSKFYPPSLLSHIDLFKSYMTACETITGRVLETLAKGLNVDGSQFKNTHTGDSSTSMLRLTQTLANVFADGDNGVSTPPHSDFGSVTVLFNWIGGLQIRLPPGVADAAGNVSDEPRWAYVRPLKNHAIINLGDAMVTFTKGKLKSGPHRVIAPPGDHRKVDRHSIVYFLRPEDHAKMMPFKEFRGPGETDEGVISAREWVMHRFKQIGSMKD